jgi:hypothetical protein
MAEDLYQRFDPNPDMRQPDVRDDDGRHWLDNMANPAPMYLCAYFPVKAAKINALPWLAIFFYCCVRNTIYCSPDRTRHSH